MLLKITQCYAQLEKVSFCFIERVSMLKESNEVLKNPIGAKSPNLVTLPAYRQAFNQEIQSWAVSKVTKNGNCDQPSLFYFPGFDVWRRITWDLRL